MTGFAVLAATGPTWHLGSDLRQLTAYPFMVNALRAGALVAMMAGAVGWFMVLRRQSFAGHSLSMIAFPGASGAILLGINPLIGYFGMTGVAALAFAASSPRGGRAGSREGAALIGTVQAFVLALGFLFVSLYKGLMSGPIALLFGSIVGISNYDVTILAVIGAVTAVVLAVIARPLFFATVDEEVARARGVPVRALSFAFFVLLGVTAAGAAEVVGATLTFALLVLPAATAQRLTARPVLSMTITIGLSIGVTWIGMAAAFFSVYPIGFFVTTVAVAVYVVAAGIEFAARRSGTRGALAVGKFQT